MTKDEIFKKQVEILLYLHQILDEEQLSWINFVIDDDSGFGYAVASTRSGVLNQANSFKTTSALHNIVSDKRSEITWNDLVYPEDE